MSDIRDVVTAIHEADSRRSSLETHMSQVEDGRAGDVVLAIGLAAEAICAQLASLTTRLDYLLGAGRQERRGA